MSIESFKAFAASANQHLSSDFIIAHDNKCYNRQVFTSNFHRRLAKELADPEKTSRILKSFENHLSKVLKQSERELLEDWIVNNVRFIGAIAFFDYWKGEIERPIADILTSHRDNVLAFFEEIHATESPCSFPVMKNPNDPKNIVIITTTGGGGHKSVADALEQILKRFPDKYKVTVIDTLELFKECDSLFRLSGLLTAEYIYEVIYQQQKAAELAQTLWKLKLELNNFVPDTSMRDLKTVVRRLEPDLILSTRHFLDHDLELASSLGVPLRFVHCDYELNWALVPLVAKVNPQAVKLWLPAQDPEILRPVSSKLKSELIQQLTLTHSEEDVDRMIERRSKTVIDYSGYPVRSSFKRVRDPEILNSIRKKHNVAEGSQFVVLQMGKLGIGTMAAIVKILTENKRVIYDKPIHVAVMCGTNEKLRNELVTYCADNKHPQLTFEILPFANQEEVAECLNISHAVIMKPGGASSGEAIAMGVNTLVYLDQDLPWEEGNKNQMVRHQMGTIVNSLETIPEQLKEVLAKPKTHYMPIDAAETVPQLIDEAIKAFAVFMKSLSMDKNETATSCSFPK